MSPITVTHLPDQKVIIARQGKKQTVWAIEWLPASKASGYPERVYRAWIWSPNNLQLSREDFIAQSIPGLVKMVKTYTVKTLSDRACNQPNG